MTWRIKNWNKFQHYKHRDPPWIRLYRSLLNDREWFNLDGSVAKMLVNCWLIASERDGELPSVADLSFRLRISEKQVNSALSQLSNWLVQDASTPLADCYQDAPTETETETETDISINESDWPEDYQEQFWAAYPRKVGKTAALRKLDLIKRSGEIGFRALLSGVGAISASEERFIPHPTTWLNQGRYLDGATDAAAPRAAAPKPPAANLPSNEELERKYAALGRKDERASAEGAGVLASGVGVRAEKQNGMGLDRNGHRAVQGMGGVFPSAGLGTVCDPADAQGIDYEDDDADALAGMVCDADVGG